MDKEQPRSNNEYIRDLQDVAEMLWTVIANVSEGDWSKQTEEWQEAAKMWRDNYFKLVNPPKGAVPKQRVIKKSCLF